MLNWFRKLFSPDTALPDVTPDEPVADDVSGGGIFSSHFLPTMNPSRLREAIHARNFSAPLPEPVTETGALDSDGNVTGLKSVFAYQNYTITERQLAFFGSQSFLGYQLIAILAQNWLINKACLQPAKDAIRNGYEITANEGVEVLPETLSAIRKRDVELNLQKNLLDFVYMGRMFGIRIAKFDIVSSDENYYEKPFNPDGVTRGSYRGITQIDPYWITPELNGNAAANPDSQHFYEPTWWRVNGKRIHRSHLIIFKGPEVPDVLKPAYIYGGLSIPQMIFERVYAAERTANEAPMLAQSKRETVIHVDVEKAVANQALFEEKMATWTNYRNNFGVKVVGTEETIEQFETSLADLDLVIMTQYQLVASVAGVPVTKLLGTVPKGFNSTGEYDEASYHEELESIQAHDLDRLLERHYLCVMRSDVEDSKRFSPVIKWNPLDSVTAKEAAEIRKIDAETGSILVDSGAIDGVDERARIMADKASGYNGLESPEPETPSDAD